MVGKTALLRVRERKGLDAGCDIWLHDAAGLDSGVKATLGELKKPVKIAYPGKQSAGSVAVELAKNSASPDKLAAMVGGKASGMALLQKALPLHSPKAIALSFDLWDHFLAGKTGAGVQLSAAIQGQLKGIAWPLPAKKLSDAAAAIRADILATSFATVDRKAVLDALATAGFSATHKLRFRSSTNVEDGDHFTGAGLYDSYSGCLADDLDDDDQGPSLCNAKQKKERGVMRAIRKVFASFYNDGALRERLRHGVVESEVAMGVVVHHGFPDVDELANGVATLDTRPGWGDEGQLVTQLGAVSVTNPSTSALPEVMKLSISAAGTASAWLEAASSLVPLGTQVMSYPSDYKLLGGYLDVVRKAYESAHGLAANKILLDFEFKKVKSGHIAQPKSVQGDWLVIKQVRPLPLPNAGAQHVPLLVGDTARRCTFQGEQGDVFAIHRLKSHWTLTARQGPAEAGKSLFAHVRLEYVVDGKVVILEGDPSTFSDFAHSSEAAKGFNPPHTWHQDSFAVKTAAGSQQWRLRTLLPSQANVAAGPSSTPRRSRAWAGSRACNGSTRSPSSCRLARRMWSRRRATWRAPGRYPAKPPRARP